MNDEIDTALQLHKVHSEYEDLITACVITLNSAKWNAERGNSEPALVRIEAVRTLLIEAMERKEEGSGRLVKDLRMNKWLDPECADKGACQSLVFKHRYEEAQGLVLGSTVEQIENALAGAHALSGPLHERIAALVDHFAPKTVSYDELLTPENLSAWIPSVMDESERNPPINLAIPDEHDHELQRLMQIATSKIKIAGLELELRQANEKIAAYEAIETDGNSLEANVKHLLDKCPFTVRDMSGDYTGSRGKESLVGSLAITFLGMQSDVNTLRENLARHTTELHDLKKAHAAELKLIEQNAVAVVPDGWRLVKQDRLDAIRLAATDPSEPAYRGRGVYHEDIVHGNWNACRASLSTVRDEIEAIAMGWDVEDNEELPHRITSSRESFERWYLHQDFHTIDQLQQLDNGQYLYADARDKWVMWQAISTVWRWVNPTPG